MSISRFNSQILGWVEQRFGIPGHPCLVSSLCRDVSVGEASPHCDTSMILLKKGVCVWVEGGAVWIILRGCALYSTTSLFLSGQDAGGQDSPVVMVDELMSLHPHQFSFSEASLRVMITPHFSPRTRLSMAGRMLITEVLAGCLLAFCMSGWDSSTSVAQPRI